MCLGGPWRPHECEAWPPDAETPWLQGTRGPEFIRNSQELVRDVGTGELSRQGLGYLVLGASRGHSARMPLSALPAQAARAQRLWDIFWAGGKKLMAV
jgi:hypothetical protein